MKKIILVIAVIVVVIFVFPAPEADAMDPVTISLLAPVALKVAQVAAPYVIQGLINMSKGLLLMGKDVLEIFLLPLGLIETTFLAPFGFFGYGVRHIFKGFIAPLKMAWHGATLPVRMIGVDLP